eukprot:3213901-Pyramimonas_sp.AAC.1
MGPQGDGPERTETGYGETYSAGAAVVSISPSRRVPDDNERLLGGSSPKTGGPDKASVEKPVAVPRLGGGMRGHL